MSLTCTVGASNGDRDFLRNPLLHLIKQNNAIIYFSQPFWYIFLHQTQKLNAQEKNNSTHFFCYYFNYYNSFIFIFIFIFFIIIIILYWELLKCHSLRILKYGSELTVKSFYNYMLLYLLLIFGAWFALIYLFFNLNYKNLKSIHFINLVRTNLL